MALPIKHRDLWTALTAPFDTKFGSGLRQSDQAGFDLSESNGFVHRATTVAGDEDIDLIGTDNFNRVLIAGAHERPLHTPIVFNLATSASETTQRFFIADQPYEIRGISLQYDTADGAANTGFITKEVAGQAPGAGISVQTGTFNLNTTTKTPQVAVIPFRSIPGVFGPQEGTIALNTGEMLSFKMASAVTSLAGLNVTIVALPMTALPPAVINLNANAAIATQAFYLANRPAVVTGVQIVVSANTAAAGTITVTKDSAGTAPGAGTAILSAALNPVVANIKPNIPLSPALTATAATLALTTGDRLSVLVSGTITSLAGVVIVVSFANMTSAKFTPGQPTSNVVTQVMFVSPANAAINVAASFFIADRDYRMYDVSFAYSVAGTGNVTVTVDPAGTTTGAGTSVLTDQSNAGPLTTASANTALVGTLATSPRTIFLPAGSRLSIKYGGTLGSLAGLICAASIQPW